MKRILITIFIIAALTTSLALGTLTNSVDVDAGQITSYWWTGTPGVDVAWLNAVEVEDILEGTNSLSSLYFEPTDTAPTANEGQIYYNDTGNAFIYYNGSSWVTIGTSSGGDSLDTAYNNGNGITVDGTAVTLTVGASDNNSALAIVHGETTNDNDAVTIANSADAGTAVSIQIDGAAGYDIQGTSDTWNVSIAGAATLVGVTTTGELLVTTSDVLFDDTYDVAWDTSADMLIFQDNAVLGIGGAHDGAADITIKGDGTNVLIEAVSDNWGQVRIGSTNAIDWAHYGSTNSKIALWDASAAELLMNGYDIRLSDDDLLTFGDSSASDSFVMDFDETTDNLVMVATTANDAVQIGDATTNTDLKLMGTTSGDYWLFDSSANELVSVDCDLKIGSGSQIEFEDSSNNVEWAIDNVTTETLLITPTETSDDQTVNLGNATNTTDLRLFGATASTVVFDASADEVLFDAYDIGLQDGDLINFGDGDDWYITSGTAKTLDMIPGATADSTAVVNIGADGAGADLILFGETASQTTWWDASTDQWFFGANAEGVDVTFYGDTASSYAKWDENGGTNGMLLLEAADIALGDGDLILFGDALGTGDIKMYATGTDFIIDGVVAETGTVAIGLTDVGLDFKLWAATNAEGVLWDASDEALEFTGANVTLDAASVLTLGQTVNADVVVTTGTYAVLTANSGKVHVIPDLAGNTAINLPAEADGLYYKFIYCGAAADAHDHTIDSENNTNFFIGGVAFIDSDAGAGADELSIVHCDGNSNSEIVCNNLDNGSVIELHCDGTNWYLTGTIYSDTTPTVADN